MKISNFKILCLLAGFLLVTQATYADARKDYTKVIHKNFQIKSDGLVDIENSRGSVDIISWDKANVDIEVTITVDAKSEEVANDFFDQIEIQFADNGDKVSAKTELNNRNNKKSWWNWAWGGKNKLSYQIDYVVKMPKTCNLDLEHSYGHATVTDLMGNADIHMKYGDLRVGKIGGDLDLELGYGDAKVSEASNVDAEVWYSEFSITSIERMDIESRYSQISVDYANDIDSESQYDKYSIGQIVDFSSNGRYDNFEVERVKNIDVESRYSDYVLDQLSQSADMEMEYGEAKIKRLVAGFSRVKMEGRHVDFRIFPDKNASYRLDIESDYTGVEYPSNILRSNVDKKGAHLEFDGIIGSEKEPNSEIRVRTNYGQLIID